MKKIDKNQVVGLPPHSHVQFMEGVARVYFQYCYSVNGKRFSERDYLGKVDTDLMEFVPNAYFMRESPVFEERPIHHFRNEIKRRRELMRRNKALLASRNKPGAIGEKTGAEENASEKSNVGIKTVPLEESNPSGSKDAIASNRENPAATEPDQPDDVLMPDETRQIGATAIAFELLEQIGMTEDIGVEVFNRNLKDTVKLINLGVHEAVTSRPTYFAAPDSATRLFIGGGCVSSPRASEFFQRIGSLQDLSRKIGRARYKRIGHGSLLALDGTKIDCNAKNIAIASVGKDKGGGSGRQAAYSLLVHMGSRLPVGYDLFAGNVNDIASVDHYLHLWEPIGVDDKAVVITMDRGLFSQEAALKFDAAGNKFIFGVRTNIKAVSDVIKERNYEFYEPTSLVRGEQKYGVKSEWTLSGGGRTVEVDMFVYRDPNREMAESEALWERLVDFKKRWDEGDCDTDSPLLRMFKNPEVGKPLHVNKYEYNQECFLHGYFAYAGNVRGLTLRKALKDYSMRNEVEVHFKGMFMHLTRTTRVHSLEALNALMLAVFVGLGVHGALRDRMRAKLPESWDPKENGLPICSRFGVEELLVYLNRIALSRTLDGKLLLKNCTKKDRDLVKALGMDGLFDSPERAARLFSRSRLGRLIGAKENTF